MFHVKHSARRLFVLKGIGRDGNDPSRSDNSGGGANPVRGCVAARPHHSLEGSFPSLPKHSAPDIRRPKRVTSSASQPRGCSSAEPHRRRNKRASRPRRHLLPPDARPALPPAECFT